MFNVGDKVYVWEEDDLFARKWDGIFGNVTDVTKDSVTILSLLDDQHHIVDPENVFHIGTGPIMNVKIRDYPADDLFEDIEGDPDNVLMNIPRAILVQMGLDIGDELVIEYDNNGLVLRKKEVPFTKEYEDIRAQKIEDTEPHQIDWIEDDYKKE